VPKPGRCFSRNPVTGSWRRINPPSSLRQVQAATSGERCGTSLRVRSNLYSATCIPCLSINLARRAIPARTTFLFIRRIPFAVIRCT
jgi:hypothetical protein